MDDWRETGYDKITFKVFDALILTLCVQCISESCIKIKTSLNFYFHTSLWCLKRFDEGLHKTF